MMKTYIQDFRFTKKHVPVLLLIACLLAFGLMAPFLGFYQDDWLFVYYYITRGTAGLVELFVYDGHPLAAWSYVLSFGLLGVNPLAWQLFSIFWRWLAGVVIWKILDQLWPERIRETCLATLIFLLYPAFILQPQAASYFEVWVSYVFLGLSFYFMGRGIKEKHFLYPTIGILAKVAHLFTSEYVTGLEFIRPLIIWYQLPKEGLRTTEKFKKMLAIWAPYLLVNLAYIAWRIFIYRSPVAARTDPVMIRDLLTHPLETVQTLALNLLPDLVLLLVSTWNNLVNPEYFDFSKSLNLPVAFMILAGFGFAYFSLKKLPLFHQETPDQGWPGRAILFAIAGIILGLAPYYAIGYFMVAKNAPWNGRIALGSIVGAGMLVTIVLDILISSPRTRNIIFSLLLAFLIGWHIRSANDFRQSWEKQLVFYRQLTWRIPALQKNTALITEQEILPLMGDYPTALAINSLYGTPTRIGDHTIPYWFFTTTGDFLGREKYLAEGLPIQDEKQSVVFHGQSRESIVLSFEPEYGQCLWVLRPEDADSSLVTPTERVISKMSNLDRIIETKQATPFLDQVGGADQEQTWCYFYEKADLARQFQRWDEVIQLWKRAQKNQVRPANGFEYTPFIEAYARQGNWNEAATLVRSANRVSRAMFWSLCPLWQKLTDETAASAQKDAATKSIEDFMRCTGP